MRETRKFRFAAWTRSHAAVRSSKTMVTFFITSPRGALDAKSINIRNLVYFRAHNPGDPTNEKAPGFKSPEAFIYK